VYVCSLDPPHTATRISAKQPSDLSVLAAASTAEPVNMKDRINTVEVGANIAVVDLQR